MWLLYNAICPLEDHTYVLSLSVPSSITCTLSLSLFSHSPTLLLSSAHIFYLPSTHPHTFTLTLSPTISLSLTHTLSLSLTQSLSLSLSLSHAISLTVSLSLYLSTFLSLSQSLSQLIPSTSYTSCTFVRTGDTVVIITVRALALVKESFKTKVNLLPEEYHTV